MDLFATKVRWHGDGYRAISFIEYEIKALFDCDAVRLNAD